MRWKSLLPNLIGHGLVAAVLGLLLIGCSGVPDYWPTVSDRKEIRIDVVERAHAVIFPAGSAAPPAGELAAIERFLAEIGSLEGDQFVVGVAEGETGAELARSRALGMIEYLEARGISALRGEASSGAVITMTRYVAILPACPDFRKPSVTDFTNLASSNFGCASAINLSLMVANPADLHHGRTLGGADGVRMADAVHGYRTGALPPPRPEEAGGTLVPAIALP